MENFKTNFSRRPNLFDDEQISTERIQKYRTAQTINVPPANPLQRVIEKLKENPFQSSISTIPAPLKMLQTTKCFPMAESFSFTPVMGVIKEDNFIEYSLTDFHPKDSKGHKAVPMDFSLGDPMTLKMFSTLQKQMPVTQMEVSLGDCPITSELINAWGNRVSAVKNVEKTQTENTQTEQGSEEQSSQQSSEQRVMDPISFDNIELTTSCMVQFTGPSNTGPRQHVQVIQDSFEASHQSSQETESEEEEEVEESEEREESSDSEDTEENEEQQSSEGCEESQVQSQSQNQSQSQSQSQSVQVVVRDSWCSAPVVEKEDKSMCTEDLQESVMPQIRILVDQEVDTADLVPEKIEEEKPEMAEMGTDTQCLVINQDQVTDTNELVEEEKRRNLEQIRALKLGFLAKLNGLKKELASVTEEQSKTKETIRKDLNGTIDNLSELVKANFNEYIEERKSKQMKNLMVYKQEVAKTKEELSSLRSIVVLTIEKIKETMATYLQQEGKNQLQKLIEDSSKERLLQFGLNKLNEYMMDNQSVCTESSIATPLRVDSPTRETPKKMIVERKTRERKPKKMDKAVLEGMRYLLGHEGFDENYKDKLETVLKPQANSELTSELVLNSLMGRGRRRRGNVSASLNAKEDSVVGGKRMRVEWNSLRDDESIVSQNLTAFEIESVTSEKLEFSTPVKGGERKRVKRQQYNHPDFLENHSEKMVLFQKDLNE